MNIISSIFSFEKREIKNTFSFNIGNNFTINFIIIIALSLSFPNERKSFLSIIIFSPTLKYFSINFL